MSTFDIDRVFVLHLRNEFSSESWMHVLNQRSPRDVERGIHQVKLWRDARWNMFLVVKKKKKKERKRNKKKRRSTIVSQ